MLPALVVVAVCAAACIAYGIAIERRWYRLRTYDLAILPPDGPDRLDVLHLSDLHVVRGDAAKRRFLAGLPQADVTIVTGDLLAEPEAVETAVEAITREPGPAGELVRARVERLLRAEAPELLHVLPPRTGSAAARRAGGPAT